MSDDLDRPETDEGKRRLARIRATAAKVDSHPFLLEAARRLRGRLPGDDRFGDPLSTAGDRPVHVIGRGVSALQPARDSVARELGMSALQVWQEMAEASGRGRGTEDVTLLFTDLAGFSTWALEAGDGAAVELLRRVGSIVEAAVTREGGRIVKRLGDGVMARMPDPDAAVAAALSACEQLADVEVAGHRPQLRTGIHHGRPRRIGGDYLGVDVNVAARVASGAKAGEILVSGPVSDRLDQTAYTLKRKRRFRAKGTPKDLEVFAVERT